MHRYESKIFIDQRFALAVVALMGLTVMGTPAQLNGAKCPAGTMCFTLWENCIQKIMQALGSAKRTILVQAYGFIRDG
jgi:hypothetical protein